MEILWKRTLYAEFWVNRSKFYQYCAFPKNFYIRRLGEITVTQAINFRKSVINNLKIQEHYCGLFVKEILTEHQDGRINFFEKQVIFEEQVTSMFCNKVPFLFNFHRTTPFEA